MCIHIIYFSKLLAACNVVQFCIFWKRWVAMYGRRGFRGFVLRKMEISANYVTGHYKDDYKI